MKSFKSIMNEKGEFQLGDRNPEISRSELKEVERQLDQLFKSLNIDIAFTNHFFDRLNDARNKKQITVQELIELYTSLYTKFGVKLSKSSGEVSKLIKSLSSDINIPVAIKYDPRKKEVAIVALTTMRKKNFKTKGDTIAVESYSTFIKSN